MQFTDFAAIAGTRRREDGYLVAEANIARTGIQNYRGSEMGRDDMDIVRVYRSGTEVFSPETLTSAAHRPVTNDHPGEMVTSENWKKYAVGQTGDEIKGEGIFIRVPLMVSDEVAIKDIEAGKRELSAGYTCDIEFTPGTTPDGDVYDAIQKNIRLNHVAIVQRGRAGSQVRIGDVAKWGAAPIIAEIKEPPMDNLQNVIVDGLSVQTTEQGAQAIAKLQKDAETAIAEFNDIKATHKAALADKDKEIGTLKIDLKKATDSALKPADIDKLVADRTVLLTTVKAIDAKIEVDGKSDTDLRRAAVASKYGDEMVKDASDDQVTGMFMTLAKDDGSKTSDKFADTLKGGVKTTTNDNGQGAYEDRLSNAWKPKEA